MMSSIDVKGLEGLLVEVGGGSGGSVMVRMMQMQHSLRLLLLHLLMAASMN